MALKSLSPVAPELAMVTPSRPVRITVTTAKMINLISGE